MIFIICTHFPLLGFKGAWHECSLVHSLDQLICLLKCKGSPKSLVPGGCGPDKVCLWCPFPHWWFGCIQLISVRGSLSPSLLPGNPSRSCVVSFQESDVPRERGQSLRAAHVFRVRTAATLRFVPLTCVSCSLDLRCPMSMYPHISLRLAYALVYISQYLLALRLTAASGKC